MCVFCSEGMPDSTDGNRIAHFFNLKNDGKIKNAFKTSAEVQEPKDINVNNIESVFLAAADGVMVAFAELSFSETSKGNFEGVILAKHIGTNGITWSGKTLKETEGEWELKLTTEKSKKKKESTVPIKSFATVTKDNIIYHITISNEILKDDVTPSAEEKWHVRLVVGKVSGTEKKTIAWSTSYVSGTDKTPEPKKKLKTEVTELPPSNGHAFVSGDNIIFFMKGKTADNEKNIIALFQLKNNGGENFEFLHVENIENCHPSFFQWEEEIIMTPTTESQCENNKVKVLNEEGNAFKDFNKPISYLRDFFKNKKYFATATIGVNNNNKNVLLFTQQEKKTDGKNIVHLWMSDGTRVSNAGTIVDDIDADNTFYGSILHANDELFALYHTYKTTGSVPQEKKFILIRLADQLKNITVTLTAWKQNENKINELCKNTSTTRIPCFTDGLVGFLCGDKGGNTNNEWKNEYSKINAKILGKTKEMSTKVQNGVKFNGAGAGAQWPANAQGQNQPYNFTDPGFALVATVTIDKMTADKDNSVLGFCTEKKKVKKHIGLWCTKESKWSVGEKGESAKKSTGEKCNKDTTYQVALSLQAQKLSVYIDGKNMKELSQNIITGKQDEEEKITHFYFGVDTNEGQESPTTTDESYVTVTNVLLYNRPFNDSELDKLKNYVKPAEVVTPLGENTREQPKNDTGSGSDQQTPTKPASPTGEEKAPSPSRTEDGGAGGGVRVFSLLLAVLCASAPLLHL